MLAASPKPLRTIQPNQRVPDMRVGDCGEPVATLRQSLEMVGIEAPVTSGNPEFFDDGLRRAVVAFQKKMGISPQNGVFTPRDFKFLSAEADRLARHGKLRDPQAPAQVTPVVNTATTSASNEDLARKLFPGVSKVLAEFLLQTPPEQYAAAFEAMSQVDAKTAKFELDNWLQKHGKDPMRANEVRLAAHAAAILEALLNTRKVVPFRAPAQPNPVSDRVIVQPTAAGPVITREPTAAEGTHTGSSGGGLAPMPEMTATAAGGEGAAVTPQDPEVELLDVEEPQPSGLGSVMALLGITVLGLVFWGMVSEDSKKGAPKFV